MAGGVGGGIKESTSLSRQQAQPFSIEIGGDKLDSSDHELEERVFEALKDKPGPWRTYPNPMRADGVFVGQDRPLEPYPGLSDMMGNPLYPATPKGAYSYPRQLPPEMAARLVDRLNEIGVLQ